MPAIIEETLPDHPLHAEVVLHVRRHLRRLLSGRDQTASESLALLFGFPRSAGSQKAWKDALDSQTPLQTAADQLAKSGHKKVVSLGHDADHIEECRLWLQRRVRAQKEFESVIADDLGTLYALSTAMDIALAQRKDESAGHLPILIRGETGTGKEMLATAIHRYWANRTGTSADIHIVQIAGVSKDLVYGELFGSAKGSYTGAIDRPGRLEVADGGTLLIDEVGDLPPEAQVALLRFFQSGEVQRLGEKKARIVKVRIIGATWHDLDRDVAEGKFRQDLLHRIRGAGEILLPPLRQRSPTMGVIDTILDRRGFEPRMTHSARAALELYPWPGNIRQLVHALDASLAVIGDDTIMRLEHLPAFLQRDYLSRGLDDRARGIICDVVEGEDLTQELISARVTSLSEAVFNNTKCSESPILQFIKFLSKLEDHSGENTATLEALQAAHRASGSSEQCQSTIDFWTRVRGALPATVLPFVDEAVNEYRAHQQQAIVTMNIEISRPVVAGNVWLNMLRDLQSSPLLSTSEPGTAATIILGLYGVLQHHLPEFLEEVREAYRSDRFPGVWRLAARKFEHLAESKASDHKVRLPARDVPKEVWRELAKLSTLREAEEMSGFDPKTIRSYMKKHRISPKWSKKRASRA